MKPRASVNVSRQVGASLVIALAMGIGCQWPSITYATDSTITVVLHDDLPAQLVVATPSGSTATSSVVTIDGTLHNIGQVMVYIDGVYTTTVPINAGASSFSIALTLTTPGQRMIRLVGIDPFHGAQVEQTLMVVYMPQLQPSASSSGHGGVDSVQQTGAAVQQLGTEINTQVQQASTAGPLQQFTDFSYNTLRAFDLISLRDGTGINRMGSRFIVMLFGLVLVMMPWGVYTSTARLKLVPLLDRPTPKITVPIRVVGVIMLMVPFFFLV